MKLFASSFIFLSLLSTSAMAANECFTQEINPKTNKAYTSAADYIQDRSDWAAKAPESPNMFSLAKAYAIYKSEKEASLKIGNDKHAHCYMGCRISQGTSYRVAEYVGWLKEDRDIKDCNKNSHFDEADYEATTTGAHLGESQVDAEGCVALCKLSY
jgi:uncharacterized protein YozE (UPF0346 family)